MYSEDDLLPLSALTDIVFCERRAALHQIEQIWEENLATVQGHLLHDRVHDTAKESRGDVRIARGLRLKSLRLGVTGMADVVEFHKIRDSLSESSLPRPAWMPFPVEYKRGIRRHEKSFEVQLCAQAICLEEMVHCDVPTGALFYGLSRRRMDVRFTPQLRAETESAAERLHLLFESGITPPAVYEKKCRKCSLFSVCLPGTAKSRKSALQYVTEAVQ